MNKTPTTWVNVYKDGPSLAKYASREFADRNARDGREAVAARYSDGSWETIDVRPPPAAPEPVRGRITFIEYHESSGPMHPSRCVLSIALDLDTLDLDNLPWLDDEVVITFNRPGSAPPDAASPNGPRPLMVSGPPNNNNNNGEPDGTVNDRPA